MIRYTCNCDPAKYKIFGDMYSYPRMVELELPVWSRERKRRLRQGLTSTVCIDKCIEKAIKDLWSKGVETLGCCCGHNTERAWVNVHPEQYEDMFRLGYEQKHPEVRNGVVMSMYTFYLM